ncbi:thioesterase II family protein [Streptomyces sp. NPDC048172]|uniref:thioesterase II family protein n=1 Tax=Streptomyces sp. NPDC048172 TaxID=3365505 RepID=UPI003722F983
MNGPGAYGEVHGDVNGRAGGGVYGQANGDVSGDADSGVDGRGAAGTWLRVPHPRRRARLRLVCFPHAGGSARFFFPWLRALPSSVELAAVQYPGRDDRLDEPMATHMDQIARPLAAELAAWGDVPVVLFGHSMGAVAAFETARALAATAPERLRALFVSAHPAPADTRRGELHQRDDEALLAELNRLSGTDPRLFDDEGLRELLLPAVRGDFRLIERYRYRPGPPLKCPVTALVGSSDEGVPTHLAEGWWQYTTGPFTLRALRGDHFYLVPRREELVAYLLTSLGVRTGRAPAGAWLSTP